MLNKTLLPKAVLSEPEVMPFNEPRPTAVQLLKEAFRKAEMKGNALPFKNISPFRKKLFHKESLFPKSMLSALSGSRLWLSAVGAVRFDNLLLGSLLDGAMPFHPPSK